MKIKLAFLLLLSVILTKGQSSFIKRYGLQYDYPGALTQTRDGGYLITADCPRNNINIASLIRTDSLGNIVWNKLISVDSINIPRAVIETSDSAVVLLFQSGTLYQPLKLNIIKFDSQGNLAWCRRLGGDNFTASDVKETLDKGLLVMAFNNHTSINTLYLAKLNSLGDTLWTKVSYDELQGISMTVNKDSTFNLLTIYDDTIVGSTTAIIKIDGLGNFISAFEFLSTDTMLWPLLAYSIEEIENNQCVISGVRNLNLTEEFPFLMKINEDLAVQWSSYYSIDSIQIQQIKGMKVGKTKDKGFINFNFSYLPSSLHTFIMKTDSLGNSMWASNTEYRSTGFTQQCLTRDGGFALSASLNNNYVNLVKYDSTGYNCSSSNLAIMSHDLPYMRLGISISMVSGFNYGNITPYLDQGITTTLICSPIGINEILTTRENFSIFPNPANSSFTIESELQNAVLKIYEITGRLTFATSLNSRFQTLTPNLSSGIYFVTVSDGEKVFTQKLVVE